MNRIVAFFVGAVILLAIFAGVVLSRRAAPSLDPNTPAGTVQAYLSAVIAGDYPAAARLLSPLSGCDVSDLAASPAPGTARVVLERTAVDGDHAVVTVDVTDGHQDGPFGSAGYSRSERITLQREDGLWRITGSPWLLSSCGSTRD